MLLALLTLAALLACIRYERGTDRMFRWGKKKKAWIPLEDHEAGADENPDYVPPPVEIDWTRPGPSVYPSERGQIMLLGDSGQIEYAEAQWGLVPVWADRAMEAADARKARPPKMPTPAAMYGKINAYNCRNDSLAVSRGDTKPTWREPFHKGRRCIVPMAAFYERDMSIKHWIRMSAADHMPLAVAGLWEPENAHVAVPTFALVTTEPNLRVGEFHDRMPVMLDADGIEEWLAKESKPADLLRLLIPSPEDYLAVDDAGPIKKKAEDQEPLL